MHIILRFEIELGLIEGKIKVKDLPKVWNKKVQEIFGIKPRNDREGVLQDVHWSHGSIGYFPTYAIGTIYAAQLYEKLKQNKKNIEIQIAKGNYSQVQDWLKKNIHSLGSGMLANDVIKKVCGEGLNHKNYISYLDRKFSKIYKLK